MNINDNNYELWLLRYAEQELTSEERGEVEQWLATHPEAAKELALYADAPHLERDEQVHYEGAPLKRAIPLWPALLRWTAAAAVVAVLMMPAMRKVVAPPVEPTLVANLDSMEIIDNLESLNNPAVLEKIDKTDHQKPLSSSDAHLLAENIQSEAQQIPDASSEENLPETEEPARPEIAKPAYIVVDDLIVFENDTSEDPAERDILADADITYTQSTSNINPIGHFISTFIKANK